jgi:hypothetical protein
VALLSAGIAVARPNAGPTPGQLEMQRTVESPDLTVAQKLERLRGMTNEHGAAVLPWIHRLDPEASVKIAVQRVNDPAVPREEKVRIADTMMRREMGAIDFIDAYAPVLVELVVHGGAEEMMRPNPIGTPTAVGQYAWIASDFGGFSSKHFDKVADKRTIPALIECLSAPDELNRADDHVRRGNPGESSGRNTQRQQIPVALARLGGVEAVPKLIETISKHHDYWLRFHSAYAVGLLGDAGQRGEVERFLLDAKRDEERWMLFGFGDGLIKRGLGEGFKYFTFDHSTWSRDKDYFSTIYMAEQHLAAARGVKAKEAEPFYRHVLSYGPLRDAFAFDEARVVIPQHMIPRGGDAKEALLAQARRVEKVYADLLDGIVLNELRGLAPEVEAIGKATKNERIRQLSADVAAELKP